MLDSMPWSCLVRRSVDEREALGQNRSRDNGGRTVAQSWEELAASVPPQLPVRFRMETPNEEILLATDTFELLGGDGKKYLLEGDLVVTWSPDLRIRCRGACKASAHELHGLGELRFRAPSLGLEAKALVINVQHGADTVVTASVMRAEHAALPSSQEVHFFLVNFPIFHGSGIRTAGERPTFFSGRLQLSTSEFECTVDQIDPRADRTARQEGFCLTHVVRFRSKQRHLESAELRDLLDALYWYFTLLRGAATGPVLPFVGSDFKDGWVCIAPWTVKEGLEVNTWLPEGDSSGLALLLENFLCKWRDSRWREGLRSTIAWYVAGNASRIPNEVRIALAQIGLEVLAALHDIDSGSACDRITALLSKLRIHAEVPVRLAALHSFAASSAQPAQGPLSAPECLTRLRNKLEHPTEKNRRFLEGVSGVSRMEAAQYGLELLELATLSSLGYAGTYCIRAHRGWKGTDELLVPWMV